MNTVKYIKIVLNLRGGRQLCIKDTINVPSELKRLMIIIDDTPNHNLNNYIYQDLFNNSFTTSTFKHYNHNHYNKKSNPHKITRR